MTRHALVVEEADASSDWLAPLLRQRGFRLQFVDAEGALARARQVQPDLIVLHSRPLCRALKLPRATADLPVVLLGVSDSSLSLQIEPDAVAHPLTPRSLHRAIDRALAAKAERRREHVVADLCVRVPSDPTVLEEFHDLLAAWLCGCGLPVFQRQQLTLAVREIVANSIEWGHGCQRTRFVSVHSRLDVEKVTILVRDTGPGFDRDNLPHAARFGDPLSHLPVRAAMRLREGGFGIQLARGLVDHLCYNDTGNEGLLVKYLPMAALTGS